MAGDELKYRCLKYGAHNLQRLATWEFDNSPSAAGYWIIFIHGGAWRDPRSTAQVFLPAVRSIVDADDVACRRAIRGFASLDYRLSPHPEFGQDPASTPESEFRNARHPDHILDVYAALHLLRAEHGLDHKYVLVGHSAGATLIYQLLMGQVALDGHPPPPKVPLPTAVIGVAGIYDLIAINDRHNNEYAGFITAAFGPDQAKWASASPAHFTGDYKQAAPDVSYHLLAWSTEDQLVDEPEIDVMVAKLNQHGVAVDAIKTLSGTHDDVWEKGTQLGQLITKVLERLQGS